MKTKVQAVPGGRCWCGCGKTIGEGEFFANGHDEDAFRCLRRRLRRRHPRDAFANLVATLGFDPDNGVCPDADPEVDRLLDELLAHLHSRH